MVKGHARGFLLVQKLPFNSHTFQLDLYQLSKGEI